ncbi:3-methyl-2-oxobutanoate hydroxymethyltransferase [Legionella nagasakiensis]|uniref:3-methyl-2-oxobutanoate hydroxymethyltransferase n=1 Tax=Legionella nagasakiensis TaxID=535290 RepID=UPI001054ACBC|nr:3-methyl-2-oxobutanoate hydroxymethyltransferase [Legionella nagasakiensis]
MKVHDFKRKKERHEKIVMLTCYDYPSACIVAESNIDCVLVGDSVAMVVHGHDSTIMATMDMMLLHTAAVSRGLHQQFLISDLPFFGHRISLSDTMDNVKKLMQAGAHAIKIEGADPDVCQTVSQIVTAGVPVMGHIGLTPQSIHQLGGYVVQGKAEEQAMDLLQQAKRLETAGCFAVVIECVPGHAAKHITQSLGIPTIGIGAGVETDGQVLVWHDLLGLQTELKPRFVHQFAKGKEVLLNGINAYAKHITQKEFPMPEHTF